MRMRGDWGLTWETATLLKKEALETLDQTGKSRLMPEANAFKMHLNDHLWCTASQGVLCVKILPYLPPSSIAL